MSRILAGADVFADDSHTPASRGALRSSHWPLSIGLARRVVQMIRLGNSLSPAQRSVVSAVSVEGRSIGETAAKFGISETAVRVSLHRGLAAIAKRFGQGRFGRE